MSDPLTEIVTLLQPRADASKLVEAAGRWLVRRAEHARPFFGVLMAGSAQLTIGGADPVILETGDFVLIPEAQDFAMSSVGVKAAEAEEMVPVRRPDGSFRLGPMDKPVSARLIVGYCAFGSPDASLLLSLLPRLIVVRGEPRLVTLVEQVVDETRAQRPGREAIVARLLEVLLIEALRSTSREGLVPGLLLGLEDPRLAQVIRRIYQQPGRRWTLDALARAAGMSRTSFFERFKTVVGVTPMEHLTEWRMALAKNLLKTGHRVGEVASRVGFGSISSFSTAFRRYAGVSPAQYVEASERSAIS